ncbi:TIGR04219 family outer membrane beta-barrel protein [Marinospirillum alkaliphilum]|uniref:Outer membrane protein n=1 Tax=Marinospirillum alkaliphilum DSM 21637 TaxID=1122209 RepID=A0A1K1YYP7_9GAMM|nr:TIGR04219 family outer membrane beta-barrel protein [Marinospirillum alkaliphilum]SFX66935.1 outer membrane protein [Marinospirillum alkaliphilum DSM 21637]
MNQYRVLAAGLLALSTASVQAVELNVTVGANVWSASPSGDIQGQSSDPELSVGDLGLSRESSNQYYLQLDHPVPLWPNLRISQTSLDFSGRKNRNVTFMGQTFTGEVASSVDLSHTDITAYYRFLDGVTSVMPLLDLRLELGATLRRFDGAFSVSEVASAKSESVDLSALVPMGYLAGRIGLPYDLSVGASLNTISYSGNQLTDISADLRYEYDGLPLVKPGLVAGYRSFALKLDDLDDTYGDLRLKGPYFGAYVRAGF